ncbi:MAG: heme o synthase [Bryobacteraceae bacterium]|nr:heme o synthase [Bryobacteraceae bacterium]MDW8376913.1 heme o synthase [Bryobacterales bacterium]
MKNYLELTKPRVTWLILMSTAIGFWFGVRETGNWWALLHALAGTWFIASGTFTLNQWYEREADARMRRTKDRPLPSGRVTPRQALLFGLVLSGIGFAELFWGANALTGWLGLFTEITYLCAYTPLKQKSWHATTVGAVPGAMPPLLGYAAAAGTLTWEAVALYAILFLWQFPHFYSIAWLYREDYARANIKMLPVIETDGTSTARQILLASAILIPVSLAPTYLSMAGNLYAAGAILLGTGFLYTGWKVAKERTLVRARGVLLASVIYLPVLYGLMVLDRPGV